MPDGRPQITLGKREADAVLSLPGFEPHLKIGLDRLEFVAQVYEALRTEVLSSLPASARSAIEEHGTSDCKLSSLTAFAVKSLPPEAVPEPVRLKFGELVENLETLEEFVGRVRAGPRRAPDGSETLDITGESYTLVLQAVRELGQTLPSEIRALAPALNAPAPQTKQTESIHEVSPSPAEVGNFSWIPALPEELFPEGELGAEVIKSLVPDEAGWLSRLLDKLSCLNFNFSGEGGGGPDKDLGEQGADSTGQGSSEVLEHRPDPSAGPNSFDSVPDSGKGGERSNNSTSSPQPQLRMPAKTGRDQNSPSLPEETSVDLSWGPGRAVKHFGTIEYAGWEFGRHMPVLDAYILSGSGGNLVRLDTHLRSSPEREPLLKVLYPVRSVPCSSDERGEARCSFDLPGDGATIVIPRAPIFPVSSLAFMDKAGKQLDLKNWPVQQGMFGGVRVDPPVDAVRIQVVFGKAAKDQWNGLDTILASHLPTVNFFRNVIDENALNCLMRFAPSTRAKAWFAVLRNRDYQYTLDGFIGLFLKSAGNGLHEAMQGLRAGACDPLAWHLAAYFRCLGLPSLVLHGAVLSDQESFIISPGHAQTAVLLDGEVQLFDMTQETRHMYSNLPKWPRRDLSHRFLAPLKTATRKEASEIGTKLRHAAMSSELPPDTSGLFRRLVSALSGERFRWKDRPESNNRFNVDQRPEYGSTEQTAYQVVSLLIDVLTLHAMLGEGMRTGDLKPVFDFLQRKGSAIHNPGAHKISGLSEEHKGLLSERLHETVAQACFQLLEENNLSDHDRDSCTGWLVTQINPWTRDPGGRRLHLNVAYTLTKSSAFSRMPDEQQALLALAILRSTEEFLGDLTKRKDSFPSRSTFAAIETAASETHEILLELRKKGTKFDRVQERACNNYYGVMLDSVAEIFSSLQTVVQLRTGQGLSCNKEAHTCSVLLAKIVDLLPAVGTSASSTVIYGAIAREEFNFQRIQSLIDSEFCPGSLKWFQEHSERQKRLTAEFVKDVKEIEPRTDYRSRRRNLAAVGVKPDLSLERDEIEKDLCKAIQAYAPELSLNFPRPENPASYLAYLLSLDKHFVRNLRLICRLGGARLPRLEAAWPRIDEKKVAKWILSEVRLRSSHGSLRLKLTYGDKGTQCSRLPVLFGHGGIPHGKAWISAAVNWLTRKGGGASLTNRCLIDLKDQYPEFWQDAMERFRRDVEDKHFARDFKPLMAKALFQGISRREIYRAMLWVSAQRSISADADSNDGNFPLLRSVAEVGRALKAAKRVDLGSTFERHLPYSAELMTSDCFQASLETKFLAMLVWCTERSNRDNFFDKDSLFNWAEIGNTLAEVLDVPMLRQDNSEAIEREVWRALFAPDGESRFGPLEVSEIVVVPALASNKKIAERTPLSFPNFRYHKSGRAISRSRPGNFSEYRALRPGEAGELIDWKASSRADTLLARRFVERETRPLTLLIDAECFADQRTRDQIIERLLVHCVETERLGSRLDLVIAARGALLGYWRNLSSKKGLAPFRQSEFEGEFNQIVNRAESVMEEEALLTSKRGYQVFSKELLSAISNSDVLHAVARRNRPASIPILLALKSKRSCRLSDLLAMR